MLLVTPSLLNSFSFYFGYDGENEEVARKEFLSVLRREKTEPTEAMQKGIDFENAIAAYCKGEPGEGCIQEIGNICKGGIWQESVKKELDDYLLYGRVDVVKADTVYDIKRTENYEVGKYSKSAQHRIYLYCTGLPKFSYLVSNEREWRKEDYFNHPDVENEIRQMIFDFTGYLRGDPLAEELYYKFWKAL